MQDKQGFFSDLYQSFRAGVFYFQNKRGASDKGFYNASRFWGNNMTFTDNARVDKRQNLLLNTEYIALLCKVNAFWVAKGTDNYKLYQVKNRKERKEIESHYIYDFFDNNPDLTFFDMIYIAEYANQLIDGIPFYVEMSNIKQRNGQPIPKKLVPLFPDMGELMPEYDEYGRIVKYEWMGGGKKIDLREDEILWYRLPNLGNSKGGGGWVNEVLRTANLDKFQKQHNLETLHNKGVPAGNIKFPDAMQEDNFKKTMALFNEHFKRAARKGELFGTDKNADYVPLGFSPVELDMINGMNITRDQLHQFAGVPRVMTGQPDANTMAEAKVQKALYKELVCNRSLVGWNQFLTNKFCMKYFPQENGTKIQFEFDLSVAEDDLNVQQVREYKLRNGQATPNQFLIEDGKEPVNPKDENDPMNKYYLNAGLVPIDEVSLPPIDFTGETNNQNGKQDSGTLSNASEKTKKQAALAGDINVANTALNGAQIASLVEVITQVREGVIPADSAKNILKVSYPTLDDEEILSIMQPILDAGIIPATDEQNNNANQ